MQKQPARLWITALFLGWLFDFLFFKHSPGIQFAIYAFVTLAGGFVLLWLDGIRPAPGTWLLWPPFLFFIGMTSLRLEPLSVFLSVLFSLLLMAGTAVTYSGGKWLLYGLADYFARALELTFSLIARPIIFARSLRTQPAEASAGGKPANRMWPVVRGLVIALPIVAVFAALLASADLVFAQRLDSLFSIFKLDNLPEYIFRFTYILVFAYALAGVYLHAASRSSDEKLIGLDKPLISPFFGFTETCIILGSVVLLFAVFVVIQFQYFFGGQANINLSGFTYADYVHRGFGELVAVAFFALLLFLGLSTITRRETLQRQRIFSGLGVALLALVAVILVSAYYRLILYEDAYGFTRLRTYIHVFMIWVAVLLAVVVALNLLNRQRFFALVVLLAALGFSVSLTLMNVDAFIVQRNVARMEQGKQFDVGYLATLSPDAVPELVSGYNSSAPGSAARDQIGAALACIQFNDIHVNPATDHSWQAFHFSNYWEGLALSQVSADLKSYKMNSENWPAKVTTPLGKTFECFNSNGMD